MKISEKLPPQEVFFYVDVYDKHYFYQDIRWVEQRARYDILAVLNRINRYGGLPDYMTEAPRCWKMVEGGVWRELVIKAEREDV